MSNLVLSDEDVTEITQVLDRTAGTIEHLEQRCRTERFGRPRDWTVRGVLAVLLAAARHHQTFHIEDAAELAGELNATHRQRLGAHQRNGAPLTHRQISYAWNLISRALDPADGRRGNRRRRWDLNRRPTGADWTGHHNRFGYAHHVAVLTQNEQRDNDLPILAVALTTTPASAHPARSATPLLDHITDHTGAALGDVLADAGYSQAASVDWTLAIRARGGDPIFRLHAGNQEGHHGVISGMRALIIDGHPYCLCLPERLRNLPRPTDLDDHEGRARWRRSAAERASYAYKLRSAHRAIGLRFEAPHRDCRDCDQRLCCHSATICIAWDELGAYQRHHYGSNAWEHSFARRNRVEGFFGILKGTTGSAALNSNSSRYWEYGKVTLAATLCAMATTHHLTARWR